MDSPLGEVPGVGGCECQLNAGELVSFDECSLRALIRIEMPDETFRMKPATASGGVRDDADEGDSALSGERPPNVSEVLSTGIAEARAICTDLTEATVSALRRRPPGKPTATGDLAILIGLASCTVALCNSSRSSSSSDPKSSGFPDEVSMCKGSTRPRRRFARSLLCRFGEEGGSSNAPSLGWELDCSMLAAELAALAGGSPEGVKGLKPSSVSIVGRTAASSLPSSGFPGFFSVGVKLAVEEASACVSTGTLPAGVLLAAGEFAS